MFENHKIPAFARRLADLPDEPQLSAGELKAYFDSSPEELRRAVNGVCDDAAALEGRVDGIVERTFGGAVKEGMIDAEYRGTLATKGDLAALSETTAQEAAKKCEIVTGTYVGNNVNGREIALGFAATAVLVVDPVTDSAETERINVCGLGVRGSASNHVLLTDTGFKISIMISENKSLNKSGRTYVYLAFR